MLSSRPGKSPVTSTRPMTSSARRVELRDSAWATFAGYIRLVMNRSVRLKSSSTVKLGWHVALEAEAYSPHALLERCLADVKVERRRRMSGTSPEVVIFIVEMMKN